MADDKKTSILKEALTDYKAIQEAAEANAKNKLAEEFPEKFNNLLKEQLQHKNKSAKESYKKLDEAELKNEPDMKKEVKETVKVTDTIGKTDPFTEKPKGVQKVAEDVKVTDTIGDTDPFTEKPKAGQKVAEDVKVTDTIGKSDPFTEKGKKKIEEEREKDFMGDVEGKTPNIGKGEAEKGKIFNEKLKGPSSGKPIANMTEDVNLTGAPMDSVGTALEGADELDEILTLDEIEQEIAAMEGSAEGLEAEPEAETSGGNVPYDELVEMRNKIDEMLKGMDEQKNNGGQGANQVNAGGPTQPMIDETGDEITPEMIDSVLGQSEEEQPVDETKGMAIPNKRVTTAALPGKEYQSDGNVSRMRSALQTESKKKISSLIEVNKKLTKKLNEAKKYKETVQGLVEQYKSALDKYRSQLKEMAIFNTNLAHVNNLLVNEELALTQEDKIKIINEFKKVDSITSSKSVYSNFLNEMKTGKKTITESMENKVTASIQPSSKQKLDEVVEKTAYADDKHIQKMKKLIETIEHRGKK